MRLRGDHLPCAGWAVFALARVAAGGELGGGPSLLLPPRGFRRVAWSTCRAAFVWSEVWGGFAGLAGGHVSL